ncbi:site-specific integrase [Bacteroidales bacterium OttesenSCG-928-L03]|nr:site-specific integrase [Bacteroidales bacterium OttesenSCG-928-L03]
MATYKIFLFSGNVRKDGSFPVSIRMTKDRKSKLISTNLSATEKEWNSELSRFVNDKRIVPEYKKLNARLSELETRINEVMRDFEKDRVDWTLNQFEDVFLNRTPKGNVKEYFESLISTLKDTNHFGNAECYSRTLHMLELFDNKFETRVFPEIDIKYIKAFDVYLQKRGCTGNTRKFYFKALRACMNKAIQDKEASESTYPFGKGGFNISSLEEETAKRYLPVDYMETLKSTIMDNSTLEMTRRLFLFTYYCYGISFMDAALLSKKNIIRYNGGDYIVYKRHKTKEAKKVKPIQIKITDTIQELLDWFKANTVLIEDYLLPIVSREGYKGQQLYNHIRSRFSRNNKNLKNLATALGITDMTLTSYVSRHTMAMTLQDNQIPREVISQILGHSDLTTTNTYLDSFATNIIDEAAKVL